MAALKCRLRETRRYNPPVHMIKQTQEREITPHRGHPVEDRQER
jgi:hypothetical protein